METLIEFKKRVRRVTEHRKHKVRGSLGVYDAYKWIRKNKWFNIGKPLTEHEFYSIIREINNLLSNEIAKGNEVKLPCRMGTIDIRKYDRYIDIRGDGKVITNLPIDWDKTLKLWYDDKESYDNKTLIRMSEQEIFKVIWDKNRSNFNNRVFYDFIFNKDLKLRLKRNIRLGIIDAMYPGRRRRNVG